MYTSDDLTKNRKRELLIRLFIVLFLAVAGLIYEHFSHGVFSYFMMYAFLIPFVFSFVPALILYLNGKEVRSKSAKTLWDSGTAFLTAGCILKGILEIYGTANAKLILYVIVALFCYLSSALSEILSARKSPET